MIEFVATVVINASPDKVFRFVANRENYPHWISDVSGAHVAILSQGPFGEGTLIQEGPAVMRVFHVQANQSFELESVHFDFLARFLLKHGHTLFQFEPAGQGTRVTWNAQIESAPLVRLFDRFLARRTHQNVQAGLEKLKILLEQNKG
jgi:ribosome-associated toxin RatA of RatAB toxin-antitoxin module